MSFLFRLSNPFDHCARGSEESPLADNAVISIVTHLQSIYLYLVAIWFVWYFIVEHGIQGKNDYYERERVVKMSHANAVLNAIVKG